jgi:dihydrodipicolinate synthase/N-acetylneuraminate lyase
MNRAELKKLLLGPIATVPTPFDEQYELDLPRTADLCQYWVESGLVAGKSVIKIAAAGGEGPDLDDQEWPALLRTVVNAAGPKAAIVCGLRTKNTLHTIRDVRIAQDLGAVGVQVDLPIFHHPTQDDLVRFFTDISDKIDIGVIIYNTYWFGAESITAETVLRLEPAEHIVGIKWQTPATQDYDDMRKFSHIFNVIDNSSQPVRCHKNGGAGYIDPTAGVYPPQALKVWELCLEQKYDEAQAVYDRVNKPYKEFGGLSAKKSGGYRVIKGLSQAIGRPAGPTRPPTLPCDEQEVAELRRLAESWGWV